MLNGLDPIIIFNFKKLVPGLLDTLNKIPVTAGTPLTFPLPFIPIYLSEGLTGIYIDSETKNIDVDTEIDTTSNGSDPKFFQKGIASTVKIDMVASRNSIGLALLGAMIDLIFPRVTSREYSITYLHGAVTVFSGLLHSFSVNQDSNTDLYKIGLEIQRPSSGSLIKAAIPVVGKLVGPVPL